MDNRRFNATTIQLIGREGILIGYKKGRKAKKIKVAKNLLKAGVSIDIISQTTGPFP